MSDVYNNKMICNSCNRETVKSEFVKDGFILRGWVCNSCNKRWIHPSDLEKYNNFKKLKDKEFNVKLRMVGNSYTISIPKEIILFHHIKQDELVRLSLEDKEKVVLYFSRMTKFIK